MAAHRRKQPLNWRALFVAILCMGLFGFTFNQLPEPSQETVAPKSTLEAQKKSALWAEPQALVEPTLTLAETCTTRQLIRSATTACVTRSLTDDEQWAKVTFEFKGKGMAELPLNLLEPTTVGVGTYNILGAGHTSKRGERPGLPDWPERMADSLKILKTHNFSIMGFQELQDPQYYAISKAWKNWQFYPGKEVPNPAVHNSIGWDSEVWQIKEKHIIQIPYFGGKNFPMPYILLEHRVSKKLLWVGNFHNPANVNGPAKKYRVTATLKEGALANRLKKIAPVLFTGDMNAKDEYLCAIAQQTGMKGSTGSGWYEGKCSLVKPVHIDWIMSTSELTFANHNVDNNARLTKASDHPVITANLTLPTGSDFKVCSTVEVAGVKHLYCPQVIVGKYKS